MGTILLDEFMLSAILVLSLQFGQPHETSMPCNRPATRVSNPVTSWRPGRSHNLAFGQLPHDIVGIKGIRRLVMNVEKALLCPTHVALANASIELGLSFRQGLVQVLRVGSLGAVEVAGTPQLFLFGSSEHCMSSIR